MATTYKDLPSFAELFGERRLPPTPALPLTRDLVLIGGGQDRVLESVDEIRRLARRLHGAIRTVQLPRRIGPTGDVHVAIYDWSARSLLLSVGRVNASGEYGPDAAHKSEFMACNRSHVEFKMDDLWNASSVFADDAGW